MDDDYLSYLVFDFLPLLRFILAWLSSFPGIMFMSPILPNAVAYIIKQSVSPLAIPAQAPSMAALKNQCDQMI